MPSYLSPDAKDLISRMLIVNPIQRITIAEIRKHPWFKKSLPEYLQLPKEEFFDTGVDVTKLPQIEELERGPAERLKGELHDAVVGKLGTTMGYPKDDIQDALTNNEPSAIKDAYMIVRENQMMIRRAPRHACVISQLTPRSTSIDERQKRWFHGAIASGLGFLHALVSEMDSDITILGSRCKSQLDAAPNSLASHAQLPHVWHNGRRRQPPRHAESGFGALSSLFDINSSLLHASISPSRNVGRHTNFAAPIPSTDHEAQCALALHARRRHHYHCSSHTQRQTNEMAVWDSLA